MINHQVSHHKKQDFLDTPETITSYEKSFDTIEIPEIPKRDSGLENTTQHLRHVDPNEVTNHPMEDGHPKNPRAKAAIDTSSEKLASNMPNYGNGCIYKSKNKSGKVVWKVNVSLGFDQEGKRKRTQRTAESYSAALKLQREMLSLSLKGDLQQKSGETLKEYALWWLRTVKSERVKQSTLADYEDRLRRSVFPHLGRKPIQELTVRDVETWLHVLRKNGAATRTINGARQVLGAVAKHATRTGVIAKNPVELTDRFSLLSTESTSRHNPWSKEEAEKVLALVEGTEFDLFAHLAIFLGLRRGEILGLNWSDVDFEKATISVSRTLKEERTFRVDGTTTTSLNLDTPKTRSSNRKLKLPVAVQKSMVRHLTLDGLELNNLGSRNPGSHMFQCATGGLLHPSNFAKKFQAFLTSHSVRRIRIHDIRHTAAMLGLEAGVRIEAVSQALGHTRIDVTKSIYAPYVQTLVDEFTTGMENAFNSKTKNSSTNRYSMEITN